MLLFPVLQRGIQGGKRPQSTPVRGLLKGKIDLFSRSNSDSKRCATTAESLSKWPNLQICFCFKWCLPCKRILSCSGDFLLPQIGNTKLYFLGLFSLIFATTGQFKFTNLGPLTVENSSQQFMQFMDSIVVCKGLKDRHTRHKIQCKNSIVVCCQQIKLS